MSAQAAEVASTTAAGTVGVSPVENVAVIHNSPAMIALPASALFCAVAMENMAVAGVTVRKAGRAKSVT
jgi:hypothetical protein